MFLNISWVAVLCDTSIHLYFETSSFLQLSGLFFTFLLIVVIVFLFCSSAGLRGPSHATACRPISFYWRGNHNFVGNWNNDFFYWLVCKFDVNYLRQETLLFQAPSKSGNFSFRSIHTEPVLNLWMLAIIVSFKTVRMFIFLLFLY